MISILMLLMKINQGVSPEFIEIPHHLGEGSQKINLEYPVSLKQEALFERPVIRQTIFFDDKLYPQNF